MKALTKKRKQVPDAITGFMDRHKYPPSVPGRRPDVQHELYLSGRLPPQGLEREGTSAGIRAFPGE